jgi:hypothetical protein
MRQAEKERRALSMQVMQSEKQADKRVAKAVAATEAHWQKEHAVLQTEYESEKEIVELMTVDFAHHKERVRSTRHRIGRTSRGHVWLLACVGVCLSGRTRPPACTNEYHGGGRWSSGPVSGFGSLSHTGSSSVPLTPVDSLG